MGTSENQKYKKICYSEEEIDQFFVYVFVKNHHKPPAEIILDLDATDDPLHGHQEGRFFHGYYDCYLPLYLFCGNQLLYAKLKTANLGPGNESLPDFQWLVQRIRAHWPEVRIVFRADSWSRRRRVIGKAEYLGKGENPRFVVTNLVRDEIAAQQLYLFSDRTSSATMRANQLRLYFSSLAYVLLNELRRVALQGTEFAKAQCHTIRLKLLKIGAQVRVSVRRICVSFTTGYPYQ